MSPGAKKQQDKVKYYLVKKTEADDLTERTKFPWRFYRPCKFCGNDGDQNILISRLLKPTWPDNRKEARVVMCGCGATAPIERWNQ